ncbi:uncharacterized protein LOC132064089 [Lycium ferocissimum]|uniref:uncharacterized protein LOC132064089 n=1 Tax=Lycium ferocissimum TaxID=112874 RepID=UPI002815AE28|nr:uncharacterized protein LOC132064089 [Lycium ferocissimum]
MGSLAKLVASEHPLAMKVQTLANSFVRLDISVPGRVLACVEARSSLLEKIRAQQFENAQLCKIRDKVLRGEAKEAMHDSEGILRIKGRMCVPRVGDLIHLILEEAHSSRYSIHPGATKMYQDLRRHYWWRRVKRDIADFVAKYGNCQQVKLLVRIGARIKKVACEALDLLYELCVRVWDSKNYKEATVKNLSKLNHKEFLDGSVDIKGIQMDYIKGFIGMRLIGIIKKIDKQRAFQAELGTQLDLSIAFHPQTDGQSKRTIQVLLKISPMKGVMRFGNMGKFSPRYHGPFEVLRRVGDVAYELPFPPVLSAVHLVFHVSMLKKYHSDGSYIVRWDSVLLDNNLSYEKELIAIQDRQVRKLRSKKIASVKVQWKHRPVEEAT